MQEDVYWGDDLNLYAYCENNPVTYCDPSGYAYDKNQSHEHNYSYNENGQPTEKSDGPLPKGYSNKAKKLRRENIYD